MNSRKKAVTKKYRLGFSEMSNSPPDRTNGFLLINFKSFNVLFE